VAEAPRHIGSVHHDQGGDARRLPVVTARTAVGATRTPAVIRAARAQADGTRIQVIDGPPGTACAAVAAVRGVDLAVLVAEASAFGLHDLMLAVELVRGLGRDQVVVVNRATMDHRVQDWCASQGIPVLAEIPRERRVAEAYAQGLLSGQAIPGYARRFDDLAARVHERLKGEAA
jgi:MinD superfamily P-loop ATPase